MRIFFLSLKSVACNSIRKLPGGRSAEFAVTHNSEPHFKACSLFCSALVDLKRKHLHLTGDNGILCAKLGEEPGGHNELDLGLQTGMHNLTF